MTVPARRLGSVAAGSMAALLMAGGLLFVSVRLSSTAESLPRDVALLLGEAEKAAFSHDIVSERAYLEQAERLEGSAEDLAEVERRLAVIEWKYHLQFDQARTRLLRATQAAEPARAWLALARLEQARGRFDEARKAASKAAELSASAVEGREALIARARASVGEAVERRLQGQGGETAALRVVFADLSEAVRSEPGLLEPSRLLLEAALLLDDGPMALVAWRSYFHAAPGRPAPNLVAGAGRELERLLPGWAGLRATVEERVGLARALAESRLFTEAALIALAPLSSGEVREDPGVRAILAYRSFLRQVRESTEEHYRQTILGEGSQNSWQASLSAAAKPLLEVLEHESLATSSTGRTPAVDPNRVGRLGVRFVERLSERFGAYVSIGETAGYPDLHLGHRVLDETRIVEQFGHRAELRFVVLDNMVSNGFQSWAWEGGTQHGGWNKPGAIYQVRPAYVGGSLEAWRQLHSEEELRKRLERIEHESALDQERAAKDPYAYLPGLAERIEYQGETRLLARLRAQGLEGTEDVTGEALRLAFLAAWDHSVQESSIFAHEGRHAIDKREGGLFQFGRNPELTAKLAEVAFAPEPRLALGAILSASIGDSTPHGKANLAIMKGLVEWMRRHASEITALDAARPLLPQLDLLTDEQLRAAFRSQDRLADGG